jgi:hypothetical protein
MAYSRGLRKAARRHLEAAEYLNDPEKPRRPDVAGYLYGVAGECALKELMSASGMRPLGQEQRRNDPFYAHFPELKTLLRDAAEGHWASRLKRFAEDDGLMNEWSIDMRYSPGHDITPERVERWRAHARKLVAAMEEA